MSDEGFSIDWGGTTTTTTNNTTTSSNSSSSGGSSAPTDPYTAWLSNLAPVDQKRISLYDSVYRELWGEPAPFAVLQSAVAQGLNTEEFRMAQMKNEAWWSTPYAKDAAEPLDQYLIALGLAPVYNRKKGKGKGKGDNNVKDGGNAGAPKPGKGGNGGLPDPGQGSAPGGRPDPTDHPWHPNPQGGPVHNPGPGGW